MQLSVEAYHFLWNFTKLIFFIMINFDEPLSGLLELYMSGDRCKFYISTVVINSNSEKLIKYKQE